MKALVVARLLLGDFQDWQAFQRERDTAGKIMNRRSARSVSSQIGRNYRDLSSETRKFIAGNFASCDYDDLARLCDSVETGVGLYLRLDEFEETFFPLADDVKRRVPFYAHVSISTYGLQFEYPEHHFICDLQAAFDGLNETRQRIRDLNLTPAEVKENRDTVATLVGMEKFISRSMVSASFSLLEAFLSGLFFTALERKSLGSISCDEAFLSYAKNKESAALKDRIDRVVKFASQDNANGQTEPFKSLIEIGKRYRDAIHHTTPFGRKDINAGERLLALYEVKADVALLSAILALESLLKISFWLFGDRDTGQIAKSCKELRRKVVAYSLEQGFAQES